MIFRPEKNFNDGHISGAINIWRPDIRDDSYPFSGMMAGKLKIEELFSRLGIRTGDKLIVYDDRGGCEAARLWWVLQQYGFNSIQLLNGGLDAWKKTGGMVDIRDVDYEPVVFRLPSSVRSGLSITKEDLLEKIETAENITLLDVRSAEEFSGMTIKTGASKAGRIPGSLHLEWTVTLNEADCRKIIDYPALLDVFDTLNMNKDELIVVYCHSGVRSSHTTYVFN